ncbi:hypothetical protein ABT232_07865 [Streptomyces sp. NPDC001532]|uniref:TolB family protein n=1 Tax=Streptomyces sp. NPDC001532 TaxID=3154520 RepID=UPI0033311D74
MPVAVLAGAMVAFSVTSAGATPPPRTERVTVSATGEQLTGASDGPRLSADGRHAAFTSYAPDAVPGDTNGQPDVFVRDLRRGTVERVSVASDGTQADGRSDTARISGDGRYVAFLSAAGNLVPWERPPAYQRDVYVHDRDTGRTERISVPADGGSGGVADSLDMSRDGRYLAFTASVTRMEGEGTSHRTLAYLADRRTGDVRRISDRVPSDWYVQNLRLSADGTHLAYIQRHPRGGRGELWLADLRTGEQRQLNLTPEGDPTNGAPAGLSLSADGGRVAYGSFDDRVVAGAPAYTWELYLYDARTGSTRWVTHEGAGGLGAGTLSADGRRLAYRQEVTLPSEETVDNVYVRDLRTGRTTLVTESVDGGPLTEGWSAPSDFARDGRLLGLFSTSARLVPGDTNGEGDGFVRRLR